MTIKLWNPATGALVRTLTSHAGPVYSVAFNRYEGQIMASASSDKTIKLWNTDTGTLLRSIDLRDLPGYAQSPFFYDSCPVSLAFDKAGVLAAGYSWPDTLVKVWSSWSGALIRALNHSGSVQSLAFDNTYNGILAGGSGYPDYTIKIWDVAKGKEIFSFVSFCYQLLASNTSV